MERVHSRLLSAGDRVSGNFLATFRDGAYRHPEIHFSNALSLSITSALVVVRTSPLSEVSDY